MQEIKITEEMKADAVKLINAVDVFKGKYGLRMVSVDAFKYDKKVKIFGDLDENDGFYTCDIYADGTKEIRYIK